MKFEECTNDVDLLRPLIYLWEVVDAQGQIRFRYVGKAKRGASRPRKHYRRNVNRLLKKMPYRKSNPDGYRCVHTKLGKAVKQGEIIRLTFLENIRNGEDINKVERKWQDHYSNVNQSRDR